MAPEGFSQDLRHRVVAVVDLDYFYAQCEELRRPELKQVPVVVCMFSARGGNSGAVATANYLARRFGVKSGIPIVQAKRLLKEVPEAKFLPADFGLYDSTSERVMELLRRYGDRFEQVSVDEAYLDITKRVQGDFEGARDLASEIKQVIRSQEGVTCSIGVGPNKLVAKMAADYQKPDGLTVVRQKEAATFLAPLPVGKLYGVGSKTETKLNKVGVKTIGELARYDVEALATLFGRKLAAYLHNAANGIDEEPVQEKPLESISRITTLKQNTREFEGIWPELEQITEELYSNAMEQGFAFRSAGIILILEDLSIRSRSRSFKKPVDDIASLMRTVRELLVEYLEENPEAVLRRVGVKVSDLSSRAGQLTLPEFLVRGRGPPHSLDEIEPAPGES